MICLCSNVLEKAVKRNSTNTQKNKKMDVELQKGGIDKIKETKKKEYKKISLSKCIKNIIGKKQLLSIDNTGKSVLFIVVRGEKEKMKFTFLNYHTREILSQWENEKIIGIPECVIVNDIPLLYDNNGNVFLLDKDYQVERELNVQKILKNAKISSYGEQRNFCVLPKSKQIIWYKTVLKKKLYCDVYSVSFDGKKLKRLKRLKGPEESLHKLNCITWLYNSKNENIVYFQGQYYKSNISHSEAYDCFGVFNWKKNKWRIYHDEKKEAVRMGEKMIFYDAQADKNAKSSGEIYILNKTEKNKKIKLMSDNESSGIYPSEDEKYIYTCEWIYDENIINPLVIIRKYDRKTQKLKGKYTSKKYMHKMVVLSKEEKDLIYMYYNKKLQLNYKIVKIRD